MISYTQKNFNLEEFKKIKEVLKNASYISIDCEFTKVSQHINNFDPQAQIYEKYKEVVQDALLNELGLSIFTHKEKVVETQVYNFTLFADKHSRKKNIVAENSCLYFLAVQNFDFKNCFENGIDFVRLNKFPKIKQLLKNCNKENNFLQLLQNMTENLENLEDKKWDLNLQKRTKLLEKKIYPSKEIYQQDLECLQKYYNFLEDENENQLKIQFEDKQIQNFLSCPKSEFYSQVIIDNKASFHGKKTQIMLKKKNTEQQKANQKKLNSDPEEQEIKNYFDYFGFSLIFYYLSLWKIPVIFHNGLFDYFYIYKTFYQKLPKNIEQFLNTRIFNTIYDTKQLVLKNPQTFKNQKTQLRGLCDSLIDKFGEENLKNKFKFMLKQNEDFTQLEICKGNTHEAGYDSFITGVVFYCLKHNLGDKIKNTQNQIPQNHLGTFWISRDFDKQNFSLYINKKMIGKSFFIKYNKKLMRNFQKDDEKKLITHLGQIGFFEVEDDQQQYAHILYKEIPENFDLKNFLKESNEKFENLEFLEFEKNYKEIDSENLN